MKKIGKIICIILLVFVFLFTTTSAILTLDGIGVSDILFYILYIVFLTSLIQFIRNKDFGWYNYYLSFVLTMAYWGTLLMTLFMPVFEKVIGDDGTTPYLNIMSFLIESSELKEKPDYFYDYLLQFYFFAFFAIILFIWLVIPVLVYILNSSKYIVQKRYRLLSSIVVLIIGVAFTLYVILGDIVAEPLLVCLTKGKITFVSDNIDLQHRMDNIKLAWVSLHPFFSTLFFNPLVLILESLTFGFLIFGIMLKKKLFVNYLNTIKNESN